MDPLKNNNSDLTDSLHHDSELSDPEGSQIEQISEKDKAKLLSIIKNNKFDFAFAELIDDLGLNLNLENMPLIKFSVDLLRNIDLTIKRDRLLGMSSDIMFDDSIAYIDFEKQKFRKVILNKKSYFTNDNNFFEIRSDKIDASRTAYTLRNSRVVIFWRDYNMNDYTLKRLFTLGTSHLVGIISLAEMSIEIGKVIKGRFEVSVQSQTNRFVLIGIEPPLF